jgi:hypothetical protein
MMLFSRVRDVAFDYLMWLFGFGGGGVRGVELFDPLTEIAVRCGHEVRGLLAGEMHGAGGLRDGAVPAGPSLHDQVHRVAINGALRGEWYSSDVQVAEEGRLSVLCCRVVRSSRALLGRNGSSSSGWATGSRRLRRDRRRRRDRSLVHCGAGQRARREHHSQHAQTSADTGQPLPGAEQRDPTEPDPDERAEHGEQVEDRHEGDHDPDDAQDQRRPGRDR